MNGRRSENEIFDMYRVSSTTSWLKIISKLDTFWMANSGSLQFFIGNFGQTRAMLEFFITCGVGTVICDIYLESLNRRKSTFTWELSAFYETGLISKIRFFHLLISEAIKEQSQCEFFDLLAKTVCHDLEIYRFDLLQHTLQVFEENRNPNIEEHRHPNIDRILLILLYGLTSHIQLTGWQAAKLFKYEKFRTVLSSRGLDLRLISPTE